ncbi:CD276 antigen homolog [Siniperca chuatsi]|uniref:CD276 antigen homolog n=1 Tax=Siniperca chuatsi TaxID=119488 RepID=UPI001CE15472|nr:CD276 antigen homolog [Siniperca chuatsi]
MFIVLVAYFLLLVPDATVVLDVNTTVGESTVLPCILMTTTPTDLKTLRFYWQDERNYVLYSFNEGKEMPEHVNKLYRGRITAFPQDMIRGNISVKVKNLTLEDNQNVFQVFAAIFDTGSTRRYSLEHRKICHITFHVAVPYKSVSLAVNEETMTAVCTTQRGFPEPLVKWRLQHLSDNSQYFLDPRDVNTTAVQDPKDQLYNFSSTIDIPGGRYRSVTCFIHNPTLNVTLITTHILNKGEAERSLPGWAIGLLVATVVLLG